MSPPFNPPPPLHRSPNYLWSSRKYWTWRCAICCRKSNRGMSQPRRFLQLLFYHPHKGWWMVNYLQKLNRYLRVQHFKMESIYSVRDVLHRGGWMAKLDLQDACLTVPICHSHRRFLLFQWRAQAYQFCCLPFGLATAPRVFTGSDLPQTAGDQLVQYLDDTPLVAESPEALKAHLRKAANLLEELGFLINKKRCVWTPSQRIEFLGFKVDSNIMHLYLPPKKVEKIRKECKSVRAQGHLTVRRLAYLIGLLTSTIPAVLPAPLHYRALQRLKGKALRHSSHCYNTVIPLDEDALKDLDWWIVHTTGSNGKPIKLPQAERIVESDASTAGWGPGSSDRRPMGSEGSQYAYQLARVKGSLLRLANICSKTETCMSNCCWTTEPQLPYIQ